MLDAYVSSRGVLWPHNPSAPNDTSPMHACHMLVWVSQNRSMRQHTP